KDLDREDIPLCHGVPSLRRGMGMVELKKIDLKKELKHLYQASAHEIVEVDVPAFRFLMVDGTGDPNTSTEYAQAVEALYSVSYAAKFMVKNDLKLCDYAV